jgi:hypothetical protein
VNNFDRDQLIMLYSLNFRVHPANFNFTNFKFALPIPQSKINAYNTSTKAQNPGY